MKILKLHLDFDGDLYQKGLRNLIITVLLIGIFFRCVNIDQKTYWGDEAYTSLRLAGYTLNEFVEQVFDGEIQTLDQLHQYQRIHPEKSVIDTIKVLAIEDCHPPLYYIIAWFWQKAFGDSIAVKRSLSVAISFLIFPCLYLLCRELFASPLVGWVALGLVAISPFHVLYAQEFRQYSLWTVTILLSGWTLLRAMRLNTKSSWLIYAASLSLLLYTHLFSAFIACGHLIYVLANEGWRRSKKLSNFGLTFLAGGITFIPWIVVIILNFTTIKTVTNWSTQTISLFSLWKSWALNLLYLFIDIDSQGNIASLGDIATPIFQVILLLAVSNIVIYAIYFCCRNTDKLTWLFILTLMGVAGLGLILPDLIQGGILSTNTRYLVPCYLGIQIAVAYLIATKITSFKFQPYWRLLLIAIFSVGVLSCAVSSPAQTWWSKYGSYYNPQIAAIVNQSEKPLVITTNYVPRILSLTYLLEPKVKIKFMNEAKQLKIPPGFSDIFFYRPSEALLAKLNQQFPQQIKIVYQSPLLSAYIEPRAQHSLLWLGKLVE